MLAFRLFILAMIIVTSSIIGILFSKKYANREKEIKEMKNALNMFATKSNLHMSLFQMFLWK